MFGPVPFKSIRRRLSLRTKVLAIVVLMWIAATVTVIPALFVTIRDGLSSLQEEHLTGIRNLVDDLLADNRRTVRNYAVLFSTDREVRDNLFYHTELAGEREHPLHAVQHLARSFDVEYIELCDARGRVVADTRSPDLSEVDRSAVPAVAEALSGRVSTGIVPAEGQFLLSAVAPVWYDEGRLIGTLETGIIMDHAFVGRLKALSGADLALVDNQGHVVAATVEGFDASPFADDEPRNMRINDVRYQVLRLPLSEPGRPTVGSIAILARDRLPVIVRRAHLTVTVLLALIALVSVAATFLWVRRLLDPIGRLKAGAERIGQGDFDHRIPAESDDEIGELARVFNRTAENLGRMQAMAEKLRHAERLASIGRFTAGVAHELNNPIANILGLAKLIRRDLPEDHVLREDVDIIIGDAERAGTIVRDLLLYSRQAPPKKEALDLNGLIDRVLGGPAFRDSIEGVTVETSLDSGLPMLYADPGQVEQVFINIFRNALQAVSGGGEVRVSTGTADGRVWFSVQDTGPGIPAEDQDRIFFPFYTTKKTGEGTGLGLTVSYGIVQSHGGEIRMETTEGRGSTFTVELPITGDA